MVEIWNRGRYGHVVGLSKLKSRVPQGLIQFSAQIRRYSRVKKSSSDNYIESLQILKTPTYLNVQKKTVLYIFYFRDTSLNVGDARPPNPTIRVGRDKQNTRSFLPLISVVVHDKARLHLHPSCPRRFNSGSLVEFRHSTRRFEQRVHVRDLGTSA